MPNVCSKALLALLICSPAVWALQPGAPPIATIGSMEVVFAPEQDVAATVIKMINMAHKQILVQAFSFTHKGIAQALIEAEQRGVEVKLIADAEQTEYIKTEQVSSMARAGVQVWMDSEHQNAHNKVMVIDVDTPQVGVITGSYNFTYAAQYNNAENLLVIRGNNKLAQLYRDNWLHHQAHSTRMH